jgi:hypothetical protein
MKQTIRLMFMSAAVSVLFTQNLLSKPQDQETDSRATIIGIVSAVIGSPATQITIVRQVDSSRSSNPPVTVNVQIAANTQFVISVNVAVSIPVLFDASHIAKGQRVEVATSSTSLPIVAARVKLREQALIGTVSNANGNTFTLTVSPTSAFASRSGDTTVNVIMLRLCCTDERLHSPRARLGLLQRLGLHHARCRDRRLACSSPSFIS